MRIKVEVAGLIVGILGGSLDVLNWVLWYHFDYTFLLDFVRGGAPGGVIIGISMIVGSCAAILQLVNLVSGRRTLCGVRVGLTLVFLCSIVFIGSIH